MEDGFCNKQKHDTEKMLLPKKEIIQAKTRCKIIIRLSFLGFCDIQALYIYYWNHRTVRLIRFSGALEIPEEGFDFDLVETQIVII